MTMQRAAAQHTPAAGQQSSGPVVWISIIAGTCLLLFFFQKILWLVVPFLLALILYLSLIHI